MHRLKYFLLLVLVAATLIQCNGGQVERTCFNAREQAIVDMAVQNFDTLIATRYFNYENTTIRYHMFVTDYSYRNLKKDDFINEGTNQVLAALAQNSYRHKYWQRQGEGRRAFFYASLKSKWFRCITQHPSSEMAQIIEGLRQEENTRPEVAMLALYNLLEERGEDKPLPEDLKLFMIFSGYYAKAIELDYKMRN